jgi:acetyl-CoA carboxylase carboxyl transferase subunit beta
MVAISAAIARHKSAGLPYLVYLRNPTTGGVMSSWGSLGHLTVAEPGALLGFLGPRAFEAITGSVLDSSVQVAENLYRHGLIDAVVPPKTLPRIVALALDVLVPAASDSAEEEIVIQSPQTASRVVALSRDPGRPGLRSVLEFAAKDVLLLNGTGHGETDHGVLLALARFGHASCVVVGHDRRIGRAGTAFGPAGLRQMHRGIALAGELGLPLVTMIDTVGAELSKDSEESGLATEIAQSLAQLVQVPCPTISVILGQGVGGGALAFLPADLVLVARNGWLAPLPPEGAAAILWHDAARAPEMAARMGITSTDLQAHGIADTIIPEYENAADEVEAFCRRVGLHVQHAIGRLSGIDARQRLRTRRRRYRP